jgi:hypothetical protein
MSNGQCIEAAYRKSSHSEVGNCAEIGGWRKASFSFANGNCVEAGSGRVVGVRDTKEAGLGEDRTVLEFAPGAWKEFISGLKRS